MPASKTLQVPRPSEPLGVMPSDGVAAHSGRQSAALGRAPEHRSVKREK